MKLFTLFALLASTLVCQAKMKVATLNPLLADLARQVGGAHVEVIDLMGVNGDPHTFQPSPSRLAKAKGAKIYLASGKDLEPSLNKLKSILAGKATVVEVGRNIPSITISGDSSVYVCCPRHSVGALDPHWWQSVENWRRAASIVEKEFSKVDPANAASYKAHSNNYRKELSGLKSWGKKQIASIPRSQRNLATAHAAFGYFCKEFGFKSIPIQGLNKEQSASPQYVQEAIAIIRDNKVKAIFPENGANTKSLQTISKATGAKIADHLYADSANSIIGMFQHNITTIVNNLK
ncbi:metal ABC transporter solute-binding protein, Zn/Mn family [Rubritalea spongiae]|uniref:Metal ABC transporter solute-binding protein, Zn/Mn family n=1 Tax=Rubritalea spongiae TaxID=430797 RepID=A0ABW5E4L7_9BACT